MITLEPSEGKRFSMQDTGKHGQGGVVGYIFARLSDVHYCSKHGGAEEFRQRGSHLRTTYRCLQYGVLLFLLYIRLNLNVRV